MRRPRGRLAVWGARLSISLVWLPVLVVGASSHLARRTRPGIPEYPQVARVTAQMAEGAALLPAEGAERAEASPRAAVLGLTRAEVTSGVPSLAVLAEAVPHRPGPPAGLLAGSRSFLPHSSGPAPEPVAPLTELAHSVSQPPPAAASAPSLAPAPSLALVPTPEPHARPRPVPPAVSGPPNISQQALPTPRARAPRTDSRLRASEALAAAWAEQNVRSVRFDAGYYYGTGKSMRQLADDLTRSWAEKGVNLIYYYAYNRVYGARYRTSYPGNIMEDFGRQDLLTYMLQSAHSRGLKVIAWFYGPQHKRIWETHPKWREKTADGRDYRPTADSYYLCVRNPEVVKWWLGFIDDILVHYPDLDGVDIAEAQVDTWGDHACHCRECRNQFTQSYPRQPVGGTSWRQFRADGLSRLLLATNHLAHGYGKEAHLTTVFTAKADGRLMAPGIIRDATGLDLDAILSSTDRPDVIQAELIWQQWAATYQDPVTFTAEWTHQAVDEAKYLTAGRARLIAHLEVTDFGLGPLDGPRLGTTVAAAVQGAPYGIDVYDAHLIDQTEDATRYLQMAWLTF